jgi:hypothetical protein
MTPTALTRAKRRPKVKPPAKLWCFHDSASRRYPVQAMVGNAYVYLFVPRDQRYAIWHTAYWWGVPEWARLKRDDGVHRVDLNYERQAVTLLQAFYPEARVIFSDL